MTVETIKLSDPRLGIDEEIRKKVLEVLDSGKYILCEETKRFEEDFSGFCRTEASVAVSSGTAALHLALLALGVKPGDEVITSPHTFIATVNAIVHAGGRPVLADIEPGTHNIDPGKIGPKITKRTKGIIPVHIYGHPADMDPIMEIAGKHGLFVLEDACQALGAEYRGRKAGSMGDAAAFSFFPSKIATVCGDGGMVTTGRKEVADRVEMLRNQGRMRGKKYEHDAIGFNYRMSELSAAIGRLELRRAPEWIERRRGMASAYNSLLSGTVAIPAEKKYAKAAYYIYTAMCNNRDGLREHLQKRCIESGVYYPVPVHMQPAYRDYSLGHFPVAEDVAGKIVSLPMHPFLKKEDVKYVAEAVKGFYGNPVNK